MIQKGPNNLNNSGKAGSNRCQTCKDLLADMEKFFAIPQNARSNAAPDWLTVDDIAKKLKISKSLVYQLIRNGRLEAVNPAKTNNRIIKRELYRIPRASFERYVETSKVIPSSVPPIRKPHRHPHHQWRVKDYLGL